MHNFNSVNQPIDVQLVGIIEATKARKEEEKEENRQVVQTIFDVVRHLAKQNCAFRGHEEDSSSTNRGNFLEELCFIAKFDKPLKRWMESHPENLSYFSPSIQNEMIAILNKLINESIKSEVISAMYYSIECDEVTSHKRAFMSVVVRYVYNFTIWERCIKLERVTSLTGKSLADVIISILANMNLPIGNLVGKGFDGASNMSGKDEGVQQHLTAAGADKSVYFHCFAHRLNLVLEKSVNNVPSVSDIFDTIGSIYHYLEGSPKRHAVYEEQLRIHGISTGKRALHTLSDTRWAARSDNLEVVVNTLPAIISMLKKMSEGGESAADGLLVRLQKVKFVVSCLVLKKCFGLSKSVSVYLQHENMDLVSAVSGVQSLKDQLLSLRNEEKMDEFIKEAQEYCTKKQLVVKDFDDNDLNRPKRRRTVPSNLIDGFFLDQDASVLREDHDRERDLFKREFFFSFLDWMLNELEKRFSSKACKILSLSNVFHPTNLKEENSRDTKKLANLYEIDAEIVENQFILFSKSKEIRDWVKQYEKFVKAKERSERDPTLEKPKPWLCLPSLLKVFGKNLISNLYPQLFELVKIVATLPATVASCERAHSKVKIVNNYLRASMSDERLESLVQISIERDVADKIELKTLVDTFKLASNRRLPL